MTSPSENNGVGVVTVPKRILYFSDSDNYDSDEDFKPAHKSDGFTSLKTLNGLPGGDDNKDEDGWGASDAPKLTKGAAPSSLFPAGRFLTAAIRENAVRSRSEEWSRSADVTEETIEALKKAPLEEAVAEYDKLNLPVDDVTKLTKKLKEDMMEPWDPSSLMSGFGMSNGLRNEAVYREEPSLLRMCYFLTNTNAHLLVIRREMVECRKEILQLADDDFSEKLGYTNSNNLGRFHSLLRAVTTNCDNLRVDTFNLMTEMGKASARGPYGVFKHRIAPYTAVAFTFAAVFCVGVAVGKAVA